MAKEKAESEKLKHNELNEIKRADDRASLQLLERYSTVEPGVPRAKTKLETVSKASRTENLAAKQDADLKVQQEADVKAKREAESMAKREADLAEAKRVLDINKVKHAAELAKLKCEASLDKAKRAADLIEAQRKADVDKANHAEELAKVKREAELNKAKHEADLEQAMRQAKLDQASLQLLVAACERSAKQPAKIADQEEHTESEKGERLGLPQVDRSASQQVQASSASAGQPQNGRFEGEAEGSMTITAFLASLGKAWKLNNKAHADSLLPEQSSQTAQVCSPAITGPPATTTEAQQDSVDRAASQQLSNVQSQILNNDHHVHEVDEDNFDTQAVDTQAIEASEGSEKAITAPSKQSGSAASERSTLTAPEQHIGAVPEQRLAMSEQGLTADSLIELQKQLQSLSVDSLAISRFRVDDSITASCLSGGHKELEEDKTTGDEVDNEEAKVEDSGKDDVNDAADSPESHSDDSNISNSEGSEEWEVLS